MRLAELQDVVQAHVLAGGTVPDALAAATGAPAAERWAIYTEGYRLRLAEALAVQYPALAARLGRPAFAAVARDFIEATPSVHRSIRDYGGELAAFLATAGDAAEDTARSELAAFEWRLAAAFDAAPARPVALDDLAGIAPDAWPALRFGAVPSLGRLRTTSNAVALWRAGRAALDAHGAELAEPVAAPPAERDAAVEWLILRPVLTTEFRSLPADEAAALDRLLAGAAFAELCATLVADHGDGAARAAATWLKGWVLGGLLVAL